ncbi:MAG: FliH/SctL family protein [Mucispirillum sp.]|nr:FliH/SctL family protein [Mucispirillum sp.]
MSSKVIKEDRSEGVFKMREFATVERGEKDYNLRSFADDEELSVQDMFSDTGEEEPETIEEYEDEVTDKDYWPPSRLAKAEDGIVGEKVDLPAGKLGQGFVEAPMFSDSSDDEPKSPTVIRSRNNERIEDDLPAEDIPVMHTASDNHAPQSEHHESSVSSNEDFIPNPEMSPLISESELEELKNELASYKEQIDGYKAHAEEMEALKLTVEKALMERDKQLDAANSELETLKSTLPEQLAASKEEGRQEGYEQAKVEFEKHYEAEKADYMAKLDAFYKDALAKLEEVKSSINAIDDQIPATVIGFVKTLIGQERKINDSFALNIIKQNLSRLHEFRDIKFKVNPEDVETTQAGLPDYEVTGDVSVPKGAVIVDSKSGEIALNVDTMINDLEKEINAQLTAAAGSDTQN